MSDLRIPSRHRDVGGFPVRRTLPAPALRHVGPFVFFDHMGPVELAPGAGMDVGPHPHIGLATLTYLFEGEILHRDSLGSAQVIRPGDVNWMIAGRGIAHSERTPDEARARGGKLQGLQSWLALPLADEEMEPRFDHHDASEVPVVRRPGAELRILAGTAYGAEAKTRVLSPTLYVHARLEAGAELAVDEGHAERSVYAVNEPIDCAGQSVEPGVLLVVAAGEHAVIRATRPADVMLVGGAPLDAPRHIWWNFVSSSAERIERAKAEWREGRFVDVKGDDGPRIPLPPF